MSIEHINDAEFAQEVTDRLYERMVLEWPDQDLEENLNILSQFNRIATETLKNQQALTVPGNEQSIPLDENLLTQAVNLFGEGVYHSLGKCREFGLQDSVKLHLLQSLAMDLLHQSQITVITTFGQEHTPEFQVSPEQQIEIMQQTSESALLYYINEYEKQYGPINPENLTEELTEKVVAAEIQEHAGQEKQPDKEPTPAATSQASPPTSTPQPKGPTPHDKYAAVALLLGTLSSAQRVNLLRHFNNEEKELITYYSHPQHIEQNLDLSYVENHLRSFRTMLKQGAGSLRSSANQQIQALIEDVPAEKLLSWVKHERPMIHAYLSQYMAQADKAELPMPTREDQEPRHLSGTLPPKIEDVLGQFLSKQQQASG